MNLRADRAGIDSVRAIIAERVRVRFALEMDAFVAQVAGLSSQGAGLDSIARLHLDDLYLAAACASGDERAWTEFVETYRNFVRRFAGRVLQEPHASDVADEVIADLWQRRRISLYEGRSSLRTWLGTVVSNAAINASEAAKVRDRREDAAQIRAVSDPEREADKSDRSSKIARLLADAVAQQPFEDQLLILLYYEQGLTLDEIGPVVGLSKAALSRRLKRIRETLVEITDGLARERLGTTARSLAAGLDLSRLDLDLRAACRLATEPNPTRLV